MAAIRTTTTRRRIPDTRLSRSSFPRLARIAITRPRGPVRRLTIPSTRNFRRATAEPTMFAPPATLTRTTIRSFSAPAAMAGTTRTISIMIKCRDTSTTALTVTSAIRTVKVAVRESASQLLKQNQMAAMPDFRRQVERPRVLATNDGSPETSSYHDALVVLCHGPDLCTGDGAAGFDCARRNQSACRDRAQLSSQTHG